jgi:glycosyltransferase involved in cell wall biosynthesis
MTDNTMSAEFREEGATAPPTVSVVIPVYNAREQYHRECFDSVLAQTFSDFELLLVDDGSTDGTSALCDEYADKDSRVRVIHQENKGVAAALNAGLDAARGAFCAFVDHDDRLDKTYIENLHAGIEREKTDVFICGAQFMDADLSSVSFTLSRNPKRQSAKKIMRSLYKGVNYCGPFYWARIFRTNFFSSSNIRFALEDKKYYVVDYLFFWTCCFEIAAKNGDIAATDEPLYFYRQHPESMSYSEERYLDLFDSNCTFVETLGERYHYRYLLCYLTVPFSWYTGTAYERKVLVRERFIRFLRHLFKKSKKFSVLIVLGAVLIIPPRLSKYFIDKVWKLRLLTEKK